MSVFDEPEAVEQICDWIDAYDLGIINVAGSRESSAPGIQTAVAQIMVGVIEAFGGSA